MFCPYCGNACSDIHKFCFRCGRQLPDISQLNPPTESIPEETTVSEPLQNPIEAVAVSPEERTTEATEEPEAVAPEAEMAAPETESTPLPAEPVAPAPKKGRLWPPVAALILMACIGLAAFLGQGAPVVDPNACFSIENGALLFDYSLYAGPSELTIPETVDGIPVIAISDGCFADCDGLTTVILPDSIKKIGTNAFSGCDSLRGIYIPDGVTAIGAGAFARCPALEAVYFPGSALAVGSGCLDQCNALRYLFFNGTYERWLELYDGTYPANMELHTLDGVYYARP